MPYECTFTFCFAAFIISKKKEIFLSMKVLTTYTIESPILLCCLLALSVSPPSITSSHTALLSESSLAV